MTSAIVTEFIANIDTDKEYGLAEIKAILSTAYKTVKSSNAHVKASKGSKKAAKGDDGNSSSGNEEKTKKKRVKRERDADGNILKKREPSAYNLFVKDKIAEIKAENPGIDSKEAFKNAVAMWNKEKEAKKTDAVEAEDKADEEDSE